MADYTQQIVVKAVIDQAEKQINRLAKALQNLQSDAFIDIGKGLKGDLPAALKRTGEAFGSGSAQVKKFSLAVRTLDSQIKSGAIRGGVGALGLALAKMAPVTAPAVKGVGALTTALTGLVAKTTGLVGGMEPLAPPLLVSAMPLISQPKQPLAVATPFRNCCST